MYYLQYGTFYKYENAHRFLQIVKQNGIPAKMSYDGRFFHIVSFQSFEDKATAILVKRRSTYAAYICCENQRTGEKSNLSFNQIQRTLNNFEFEELKYL